MPCTRVFRDLTLTVFFLGLFATSLQAEAPANALPSGELPQDARLQPLKDLHGYFPFTPPKSVEAWKARAEQVRTQLKVALGLWPMPPKHPLNLQEFDTHTFDDYRITNIRFESRPGFYVTGSLFRPVGKEGPFPIVLSPHGHRMDARFDDGGEKVAKELLKIDAERDFETARNPVQARCVHLARMGCVVLLMDMIGHSDSQQLSNELVHRFAKQRPEMNGVENWGFFSPQAESHLQSVMGLQIWNCIRALDLLETLPDVDPNRVLVTGASGGGTQTMIMAAIDDRVDVAFPAVMVSTAMQGGCTCENCTLLRIGTGNVEFAALFAPKPQGMNTADDWTIEMPTKGFPELKQLYTMLGAGDKVHLTDRPEFKHNFNFHSRKAMYELVKREFGLDASVDERPYPRMPREQLTVWTDENRPQYKPEYERQLLADITAETQKQIEPLMTGDKAKLAEFRKLVQPALKVMTSATLPESSQLDFELSEKTPREGYLQMTGLITSQADGSQLPALFLYPTENWNGKAVLWLTPTGKQGLFGDDGKPTPEVARLVAEGVAVTGVDLLYQGEFLKDGQPLEETPKVEEKREAATYTLGYNHSVAAQRVGDIVTVLAFLRQHDRQPKSVGIVALDGELAALAATARALHPEAADYAALNTGGFRFGEVDSIRSPALLPGGAKYGDVPGLLIAGAPSPLWLTGETGEATKQVQHAYQVSGEAKAVTTADKADAKAAVDWVLGR